MKNICFPIFEFTQHRRIFFSVETPSGRSEASENQLDYGESAEFPKHESIADYLRYSKCEQSLQAGHGFIVDTERDPLNIRIEPTTGEVIAKAPKGSSLTYLGENQYEAKKMRWVKVSFEGKEGWAFAGLLKPDDELRNILDSNRQEAEDRQLEVEAHVRALEGEERRTDAKKAEDLIMGLPADDPRLL